ncbi:MAG: glycosyltransferase [Gemmatimonadota bacterium]
MKETGGRGTVDVSVLVPVTERPQPLGALYEEYAAPLRETGLAFEFLFVTEPWRIPLTSELLDVAARGEPVRVIEAAHGTDEASLLRLGLDQSTGDVLVTLPAYRRVAASALPQLVGRVREGKDFVVARRWPRADSWINRMQTRVFHYLLGKLAGGRVNDIACGVRALRRPVLEDLPLYGDFVRFLPLLAMREGFRVEELACPQHPDDTATRLYAPGVYLRRMLDLLNLFFLLRFTFKPLRFFGLMGSGLGIAGGVILAIMFVQRIGGQGIANRPLLLVGILLVTLGLQMFGLGLVGEIIVHLQAPYRKTYRVLEPERTEAP